MVNYEKNKSAFTLVELLVVIAIIGIISTLAVVSLTNARQSARDAKRIADIKQIQTALELYYQDNGEYPATITDNSIATSGIVYMQTYPTAPTPADGDCSDSDNTYTYTVSGTENSSYSLTFCLGNKTNDLSAGSKEAIPGGIIASIPTPATWQTVGTAGFSAGQADYTSLAIYNGTPYVAYMDGGNSNKATVMKFNGTSWENVGSAGFSAGEAYDVRLDFYNGTPYVAFIDSSYGYGEPCGEYTCFYNGKITVMKYDGSNWVTVGNPGFSNVDTYYLSFFIYNGTPYVAYCDSSNSYKATAMKYDGSNWVTVGNPFSIGQPGSTSIYVYNGTPYVAYSDFDNDTKITVMKYDEENDWQSVGPTGFSTGRVEGDISLFVYNGTPYVAYEDDDIGKAVIKKFNGSNWDILGDTYFPENGSGTDLYSKSLFVYNGDVYFVFSDGFTTKSVLKKYSNNTWETIGTYGFSAGEAYFASLAIYNGIPYVAYMDNANSNKATVMKFD